ncbi:MAG: histidinol dehydrogenase [Gammaproteobacteria bacterium]
MKIVVWESCTEKADVLRRASADTQVDVQNSVRDIIAQVRARGDEAVKAYTKQFDGVTRSALEVSFKDAIVDIKTEEAIKKAYNNIKRFHELQKPKDIGLTIDGGTLRREYKAIERVGLYVPGGTAPLISTMLMLAIPARIAGCKEIVVVTPPGRDGNIHPAILYAAKLCEVTQVYACGGAQAIAALAYGTETMPKVDKIYGPGNKYVTEAKEQVSQDPEGCARDMPAGPSEVLVIADANASADFVAADLLAQAEHDVDSKAVLVTTDISLAKELLVALKMQAARLSRQSILEKSMKSIVLIVAKDLATCFSISNQFAPEHLILQIDHPNEYLPLITHAGSVFVGQWTTEALGDYASGPNHVLPTYGYARSYSGLGVESFMKSITFQEVTPEGLLQLAGCVEHLATLEGLDGHCQAVVVRREALAEVKV